MSELLNFILDHEEAFKRFISNLHNSLHVTDQKTLVKPDLPPSTPISATKPRPTLKATVPTSQRGGKRWVTLYALERYLRQA